MNHCKYYSNTTIRVERIEPASHEAGKTKMLKKFPCVPGVEPQLTAKFNFTILPDSEEFDKDLGLMLLTFKDCENRDWTILVNKEQEESIRRQWKTKISYKAPYPPTATPPRPIATWISQEMSEIGDSYIIYIDRPYSEDQLKFIEEIPLTC